MIPTFCQELVIFDLLLIDHRHPEIRPQEELGAVEVARRHPDDRIWVLVQVDGGADDARIGMEAAAPDGVAEHDVGSRVCSVLVARMEEPAEHRLDGQHIEVVAGDLVPPADFGASARIQSDGCQPVGCDVGESGVAGAVVEVIGVGLIIIAVVLVHDGVQPLRMRQVERAQDQRVQHAQHDDIGPDAEGQRQYRGEREAG